MENEAHKAGRYALRPEWLFLVLGSLFGLILLVITPPFQVADEPAHFFRAVNMARGDLLPVPPGLSRIPVKTLEMMTRLVGDIPRNSRRKIDPQLIVHYLTTQGGGPLVPVPREQPGKTTPLAATARTYPPIGYTFSAIAVALAGFGGLSPLASFYLARLANLLAGTFLTFLAIRVTPTHKWLFTALGLTPMAVSLRASISVDGIAIGLSFLIVALALRYHTAAAPLSRIPWISLLLTLALLLTKPNAVPLVLLALPPRMHARKLRIASSALLIGVLLAGTMIASLWSVSASEKTNNVNPAAQLEYVLDRPGAFMATLGRTWMEYSPRYFEELIGKLGWLDTPLPGWFVVIFFVTLLAASFTGAKRVEPLSASQRAFLMAIFLFHCALVFATVYLTWSPVRSGLVDGVQGRYFLPAAPLLFIALGSPAIGGRLSPRWIPWLTLVVTLLGALLSIGAVLTRFYA